jgi:FkbM family methyltransferase
MLDEQLRLAATAAYFDLTTIEGRGRSHQELTKLFFDLQTFIRPKTFLEIGAFDAGFSRQARERHPNSKVMAFEANPHNHKHFSSSFDFAAHRIDYRHLAISDTNGTINFQLQTKRNGEDAPPVKGDDSLLKRNYAGVEYETVTVDTNTLDTVISDAEFGLDDFSCWIDVEGATKMVFAGGRNVLPRIQSIFIEVEERPYWAGQWLYGDIANFLRGHGFSAIARDFEFGNQFNVIFVHERVTQHLMFGEMIVTYFNRIARGTA